MSEYQQLSMLAEVLSAPSSSPSPPHEQVIGNVMVIHDDALNYLRQQPEQSLDCIITDPAYWTLDKWRSSQIAGSKSRFGGNRNPDRRNDDRWFSTITEEYLFLCLSEFYRLLKTNSYCYVFCDHETFPAIHRWWLEQRHAKVPTFDYFKPLVWDKIVPGMGYHWRSTFEFVVMLEKGRRKLIDLSRTDILRHKRVMTKDKYPTQKPLALIEELLLNSTSPGDLVLDCFAGSGVLGSACLRHGRQAVLIDNSAKAIHTIQDNLNLDL